MPNEIPKFEGVRPDYAAVGFTGGTEGAPPRVPVMHNEEYVAFIVWGEVSAVNHGYKGPADDRRFVREHKVKVDKVLPLDAEQAARLYSDAKEAWAFEHPDPGTLEDAVRGMTDALGKGASMTITPAGGESVTAEGTDPEDT